MDAIAKEQLMKVDLVIMKVNVFANQAMLEINVTLVKLVFILQWKD